MTREDVIRLIVEREQQNLQLDDVAVNEGAPELYSAGVNHFGTWETALRYCGINLRRILVQAVYSKCDVVRRMRQLCLNGSKLSARRNMLRDRQLYDAARQYFGHWRHALVAAGLNLECVYRWPKRRAQNKAYILKTIRAHQESGLSLLYSCACLENRALVMAAKSAFGSWRKAIETAGFQPKRRRRWSRERIVAELRLRHEQGKAISKTATTKDDGPLACAIRRYFGTWSEALRDAGLSERVVFYSDASSAFSF